MSCSALEAQLAGEPVVPDLLTESMLKPPERSKSTRARRRGRCDLRDVVRRGSAESVPKSGSVTLTPSKW
jgi:hypothetical protein